jgi:hypothetical protein
MNYDAIVECKKLTVRQKVYFVLAIDSIINGNIEQGKLSFNAAFPRSTNGKLKVNKTEVTGDTDTK